MLPTRYDRKSPYQSLARNKRAPLGAFSATLLNIFASIDDTNVSTLPLNVCKISAKIESSRIDRWISCTSVEFAVRSWIFCTWTHCNTTKNEYFLCEIRMCNNWKVLLLIYRWITYEFFQKMKSKIRLLTFTRKHLMIDVHLFFEKHLHGGVMCVKLFTYLCVFTVQCLSCCSQLKKSFQTVSSLLRLICECCDLHLICAIIPSELSHR